MGEAPQGKGFNISQTRSDKIHRVKGGGGSVNRKRGRDEIDEKILRGRRGSTLAWRTSSEETPRY